MKTIKVPQKVSSTSIRLGVNENDLFEDVICNLKGLSKRKFNRNFGVSDFVFMCCQIPKPTLEDMVENYMVEKIAKIKASSLSNISPEAFQKINLILEAEAAKNKQS